MLARFRHPFLIKRWFRNRERSEYGLTVFYAVLIGGAVGVVGALFYRALLLVQQLFFRADETGFDQLHWLTLLLVPVAGGVIQAAITRLAPETAARKGVVEVMKSLRLRQGVIRGSTTLFHMVAPAISIGTGGSVGPEGPACQLGAGIASRLGQLFQVSPARLKVMVAAGSGAAISAIFNAPLGGVFFALEIILLNDLKEVTFGVLILASVVANVVSHAILGGHTIFAIPEVAVASAAQLPFFLLLGILGGLVSVGFMRWSGWLASLVWGKWRKVPRWIFPPLAGLLLGLTAQFHPEILGVGYHGIQQMLDGQVLLLGAAVLLVLKILLTATTVELGGFGGTFAPSLFIGAMLGGFCSQALALAGFEIQPALCILAGMGTVLAGINGIPLTAFLLLLEITGNYSLVLPMMISVSAATLVIQFVVHERSLYIYKLKKAHLYTEKDGTAELAETSVRELIDETRPMVPEDAALKDVIHLFGELDLKDLVVVDKEQRIRGMLDFADLRHIISEPETLRILRVRELVTPTAVIHPETSLVEFIEAAREAHTDYLPVQDAEGRLCGIVFSSTVTHSAQAILRRSQLEKESNRWVFK